MSSLALLRYIAATIICLLLYIILLVAIMDLIKTLLNVSYYNKLGMPLHPIITDKQYAGCIIIILCEVLLPV